MAERKLVTVLFADIVGSSGLTAARDPELMRDALERTFSEIRPILEAHGGTVEKFIGDEVMAVFGVPASHDDDADRAVRAAFAIRQRVKELGAHPKALPFELRIGVNSGETVAGTGKGGQFLVTGDPVNAAARIRASAEPSEIVVGALTRQLTERGISYGEARSFDAKGLGPLEAWPALALRSDVPGLHRGIEGLRAPLIGRDEELTLLLNAFERMRSEARPHLVTVFGAAGAGKSRLKDEFIARLRGARVREGRCLPYGEGISLWPIQMILQADAGIARTEGLATARERLAATVTVAFLGGAEDMDALQRRLSVLAGLERADDALPEVAAPDLGEELAWGLRRYLERRAASEPLVLVLEDIQWASPMLVELIEHLVEWGRAPLFPLCLARPEFLDSRPGWGGGKLNATSIVLEPLTPDETRVLVDKLLQGDSPTEEVRAAVVERAEGNPLYVEEFVRLLIETGQIAHRGGERRVGTSDQLVVPPTLKGLIAARIDTAPPPVKKLLQRAAVIGRQFPTSGLAALSDGAPPEIAHLRDAVRRDLLIDVDERGVGGGRVYRFKHVLIQDVAYASLPKGERALLHERYMRWFEDALGDRREDFIPLLAHHAEQAYALAAEMGLPQASELARRAFDRLMEAADRAKAANDVAAELGLFRRVAAIAPDAALSVEERLSLDGWLALARHQVEMSRESLDEVDRVMSRARDAGATTLLVELLDSRIDSAVTPSVNPGGERDPVREEMRALALASGDPKLIIRAMLRRITPFTSVTEDVAFLTEAVAFAAAHGLEAWRRGSLLLLSDKYRDLLRFSEADRIMSELERSAASQQSASDLDTVRFQRALLSLQRDELTAAVSEFEETIALARGMGHIRRELRATHWKARTLVFLGRWDDAIEQLSDLLQQIEGKVLPSTHWVARLWLAYALVKVGRTQEARATFEAGQAFAVANPTFHAWANWVHGVLRAAERRPEEAAGLFAKGAGQFGDSVIPHFIFDRAEVLIQSGRAPEARGLLSDLRARLNDPLADRLRVRTDDLLARAATTTVQA